MSFTGYSSDGYFPEDYTPATMVLEFIGATRRIGFSRAPLHPVTQLGVIQATRKTAGNVAYSYDPVAVLPAFTLRFPWLSVVELTDLVDFFENYAFGQLNDFTLYDWRDMSSQVVMFGEPNLSVTEIGYEIYSVDIPLLKIS